MRDLGEDLTNMSSFNSFALRTDESAAQSRSARFFMFVLLPLIAAVALVPAVAGALLVTSLFGGANAHAFSASGFTVTPSTSQAGAHPDLRVLINRGGTDSEDIKNVVVDLPPGLLGDTTAIATKCSSSYFTSDRCSSSQKVGKISTDITALGMPMTISGDIYMLTPNSTDAATLGYVLRPVGSAIGLVGKAWVKNNATIPTSNYGLKNTHLNLPTTTRILLSNVDHTIQTMDITYFGKSASGKSFMMNPSSCGTKTAGLSLTSYQNVTVNRSHSFGITGCETVPFTPTITQTFTNLNAEQYTGTTVTLNQSRTDAPQQESTIKNAEVAFPQGSGLNFPLLNSLTGCTNTQFLANSCPAASKIGTTSATVPIVGSFAGNIYVLDPIGSTVNFGLYLSGPRGTKAYVYGSAEVEGSGPSQRLKAKITSAPEFPISKFTISFTSALVQQPPTCGTQTVSTKMDGHSGASTTRDITYSTVSCAPVTNITASPASPTNDNTPAFSFAATPPTGATFQCAWDSGAFSACTSGQQLAAVSEGSHLFRVRACNSIGNCDQTPAEYDLTVDTTPPSLMISAPSGTVGTANVSVVFAAESGATSRCRIDSGTYEPCAPPSHTFIGVADGSYTATVETTDAAGNVTTQTTAFTVETVIVIDPIETTIDDGPRNGLKITDQTPTFDFSSQPAAPAYECSIDNGTFTACGSPITLDPLEIGEHTLAVRAIGDPNDAANTTEATPATATFEVTYFEPSMTVEYFDNQNNTVTDTRAASHPDVDVTFLNPSGDPDTVSFQLPDGFWGSLGAADQCALSDVSDGVCDAGAKIGTAELTAVTNDNQARTFTTDIFLTESPGGALAGLAGDMHIAFDGKDYGHLRDDALFNFEARYVRDDPNVANVHDPRGVNATANSLPNSTSAHPGPDGEVTMHVREFKVHLDGDTGADIGKPMLTSPSQCNPDTPLATYGAFTDKEANIYELEIPYQATDCELVPFNPELVQSFTPVTKGGGTVVTAHASLPDQNSTIRNLVLDLPVSIQPLYAGLANSCLPADTQLFPPACNMSTMLVGTAAIDTPLLGAPIEGEIYLEDSGNALPNLYIHLHNDELGLDVRLRGATETIGVPSHLRFKINAEADGSLTDIPDIPVTSLDLSLPGGSNGNILKVSTVCRKVDTTSSGEFLGWTGTQTTVTQTVNFDPTCPN